MCTEQEKLLEDISQGKETVWVNPYKKNMEEAEKNCPYGIGEVEDASARLDRFADYFAAAFPETEKSKGIIESEITEIPKMKTALEEYYSVNIPGRLYLKQDNDLPISGSVKARGGFYEVLCFAESVALERGLIRPGDSYRRFCSEEFRKVFSEYSIAVGSTGNLGLSIGILSAKLGFHVTVHMSSDARAWKKQMLRDKGVTVIEYESDYSVAVANGRKEAENDPTCHFVDDENSTTLFFGYSVAALRLKKQLAEKNITVDKNHPLIVFIPCGVGGAPGGIAFGLKTVFGDNAYFFFAEPTESCCMMLGLATGKQNDISVQDMGLTNKTVADGLAVGRASGFVGGTIKDFIDGCYSISDSEMLKLLAVLSDSEGISLEPSALAGMKGSALLDGELKDWVNKAGLRSGIQDAAILVWATGGGMVPPDEMQQYYDRGKALL